MALSPTRPLYEWWVAGRDPRVKKGGIGGGGEEVCVFEGGVCESRIGKKSSSVGNYKSLRNAAAVLTRQAAAWLQWPHSMPSCVSFHRSVSLSRMHRPSVTAFNLVAFWLIRVIIALWRYCVYLYHCHLHDSFLKPYPFWSKQKDHKGVIFHLERLHLWHVCSCSKSWIETSARHLEPLCIQKCFYWV